MKGKIKAVESLRSVVLLFSLAALSACSDGGSGGGATGNGNVNQIPLPVSRGLLPDIALADASFNADHHAGSAQCTSCHNDPSMSVATPIKDVFRDVSIGNAWETSMMANSTRDPYWHAVVAAELDNFPNLEDDINDKCTVCHAPMANDMAKKEGLDFRMFDKGSIETGDFVQGFYSMNDGDELFNHAMDGVSCSLCHQMDAGNLGTEESMTGGYVIVGSTTGDKKDRPAYGQYTDPGVIYMQTQSSFTPQHGAHLSTSESCATCHNLNIEPVDPQGQKLVGAAHFAEQATYTEWLLSDYAVGGSKEANCQSCHMPKASEDVFIAEGADNKRPDFAEHTFLGANTVMQDMLMNFGDELGVDLSDENGLSHEEKFTQSIERNREFMTTAASVSISQGSIQDGKLNINVVVQNNTGHKLPSGYHSRRVYLHLQVIDQDGQLVFESGKINPDGSIVGVSEDVNPATWEPHYDRIDNETQVQVYQSIVGNSDNVRTHSLLDGSFYLKDNRLTPSGFDKDAVNADTTLPDSFGVFGAAALDNDFNNGTDTVSYEVSVADGGIYTVSAALRYQPFSYGHLAKLWTQGDRVDQVDMFRTIYESTTLRDEFIDSATAMMQ
ncbi:MAG: hypothetical protein AB8B79_18355 [Granulosicoccus sp.]